MMKPIQIAVLCILVFLAVSWGITKILLMPQDAEFFGKYGFTSILLGMFGAVQVIGGVMMVFHRTRLIGAAIVAITFAISAVLLIMEGNVPFTIATLAALVFLGWTMWHSLDGRRTVRPEGTAD
jgi:hypothetical protein